MKINYVHVKLHDEWFEGCIACRDNGCPVFVKSIKATIKNEVINMADCSIELFDALMNKASSYFGQSN